MADDQCSFHCAAMLDGQARQGQRSLSWVDAMATMADRPVVRERSAPGRQSRWRSR
jgi:hypothetical protein